jgi:hypothetical protein
MQLLGTVLALALAVAAQPASKPNFSGEWKLNLEKSQFGALPPPTAMTRKITHAEPSLTIDETQTSPLGDQSTTRSYKTDGSAMTFMVQGASVSGSAKWAGNVLEVLSNVEAIGMSFTDKMSLSPDGKTLTSSVQVTTPQGNMDITVVFEKQ